MNKILVIILLIGVVFLYLMYNIKYNNKDSVYTEEEPVREDIEIVSEFNSSSLEDFENVYVEPFANREPVPPELR